MHVFEMVVLVVAITAIAGLIRSWMKTRAAAPAGLGAGHDARLARLEDRVKALEAVVGDSSYELKQKLRELERA